MKSDIKLSKRTSFTIFNMHLATSSIVLFIIASGISFLYPITYLDAHFESSFESNFFGPNFFNRNNILGISILRKNQHHEFIVKEKRLVRQPLIKKYFRWNNKSLNQKTKHTLQNRCWTKKIESKLLWVGKIVGSNQLKKPTKPLLGMSQEWVKFVV